MKYILTILFLSAVTCYGQNKITIHSGSGGGSSAFVSDSIQTHTSGATVTINNAVNIIYINPASSISTLTITMPSTPHQLKELQVYFGGTITTGTVVTSLTVTGNTGQTILQATSPSSVEAGECIVYKYNSSLSKWFRQ